MIYVCIPSHDEAETVGLVLWKIRKVFESLGREYHVVVGDDGSTDHTGEVLEAYAQVLPLTYRSDRTRRGYAATTEYLLREAVASSNRPKRDAAILMHGDFSHAPELLQDFIRRFDSGADMVVGEGAIDPTWDRSYRWTRLWSGYLLGKSAAAPGVKDPTSGFLGFRLATLRAVFQSPEPVLVSEGWAVNAELVGRAAVHARRIETVSFTERHDLKTRPRRIAPWSMARSLWSSSGVVRRVVQAERGAAAHATRRREQGGAA